MRSVARRVSDGTVLRLIKAWLRAPVVRKPTEEDQEEPLGTPQGGVISSPLANIYLHPLDEAMNEECRGPSGYKPCHGAICGRLDSPLRPRRRDEGREERRGTLADALRADAESAEDPGDREPRSGFEFLGFAVSWQRG